MSLTRASAERSSTACRSTRPADPTRPVGIVPPVPHSIASYRTTGQDKAEGYRTLLPHLLRGMAPPSTAYVSDRIVRSLTQTILELHYSA
eukprot:672405-Prymnesium_polylepis.1